MECSKRHIIMKFVHKIAISKVSILAVNLVINTVWFLRSSRKLGIIYIRLPNLRLFLLLENDSLGDNIDSRTLR